MTPRIAEATHPAWDRTAAAIAMRLQPAIERSAVLSREMAGVVAFALRPAALLALAMGVWRLGIDIGWTQDFFISAGLLSHWQVWMMLALCVQMTAAFLERASHSAKE
jgi:hypothetical protein